MSKVEMNQVAPETVAAIVSKPTQDTAKAGARARYQKGEALAGLVIKSAQADIEAEVKRASSRHAMLKSLSLLDKDGHQAFREGLKAELTVISESIDKDTNQYAGTSINSYRVLVSCWRVLSVAIQAGMEVCDAGGNARAWDVLLTEARAMKAAQSAQDTKGKNGMRAKGAGRKAKASAPESTDGEEEERTPGPVTLENVLTLVGKLSDEDKVSLLERLSEMLKVEA